LVSLPAESEESPQLPRGRWRPPQPYSSTALAPIAETPCSEAPESVAGAAEEAPSPPPRAPDTDAAEEAADPPPSSLAVLWGSNLPPLRYAGLHFSRDQRVRTAWQLGLADREAVWQWDAGRPQRQVASPVWISERPKAAYCVLRLDPPGRPGIYRSYDTYRALTHPGGLWRRGVSRGLLTEEEARVYLEAVGLEPPLQWL
jgi:hypothetical protein